MEYAVHGEDISPEELQEPGWAAIRRRQAALQATTGSTRNTTPNEHAASLQPKKSQRPLRRQPPALPLPSTDIKIVLRPRGGLDLKSVAQVTLADTVMHQAGITPNPMDQIRIQHVSNYVLISSPSEERARKYAAINFLTLRGQRYEIAAHVSAPANTVTGVIFNIPEEDTPEQIFDSVHNYNPDLKILDAKRLNTSNIVQILFDGQRVPFWVRYRSAIYRCKPFRRKTEACALCWQAGHRPDVCPNAKATTRCSTCGTVNPPDCHQCTPRCIVCEGPHLTGSADCPRRFQPRKRNPTYAQMAAKDPGHGPTGGGKPATPPNSRQEGLANTPRSQLRDARDPINTSPGNSKLRKHPPPGQGNSDKDHKKVSCPSALSQSSSQSPFPPLAPSPDILKELAAIREEITLLRQENAALRQENKSLRLKLVNCTSEPSLSNPPPPKRKATTEGSHPAPTTPPQDEQIDSRFEAIEMSCKHALLEQKHEYTNLCQTLQTSFSTLQANIEEIRSEMHSFIRGIVTGVNNPVPYAPAIAQQYDETLE